MMLRKNYPAGVYVIFFVFTFIMAGASAIQATLVLYLIKFFLMPDNTAYSLFAAYSASAYFTSLLGGYVGQRYLNSYLSVISGLFLCAVGLFIMTIPEKSFLLAGLTTFAFGSGFVYPCAYSLLGDLYKHNSVGRNSGFTMVYTGMNLGGLIGFIFAGYIAKYFSYQSVFLCFAIFIFIGLPFFIRQKEKFFLTHSHNKNIKDIGLGISSILLGWPILFILLHFDTFFRFAVIACGVVIIGILIIYAIQQRKINPNVTRGLSTLFILSIFALVFWSLYFLQPTALITFIERNVDRHVFGIIPTGTIMSFNPIYMLILGPSLSVLWLWLDKKNLAISDLTKFFFGLVMLAGSFFILALGIICAHANGTVALIWIALFFLLLSIAEMVIAPAGYAAVGKFLPSRLHGFMLGTWQLITGISHAISGQIAQFTNDSKIVQKSALSTNPAYLKFFVILGLVTLLFTMLALGLMKTFNGLYRNLRNSSV